MQNCSARSRTSTDRLRFAQAWAERCCICISVGCDLQTGRRRGLNVLVYQERDQVDGCGSQALASRHDAAFSHRRRPPPAWGGHPLHASSRPSSADPIKNEKGPAPIAVGTEPGRLLPGLRTYRPESRIAPCRRDSTPSLTGSQASTPRESRGGSREESQFSEAEGHSQAAV